MQLFLEGLDDYLFHMRDQMLKELRKNEQYEAVKLESEELEKKYPVIQELFATEREGGTLDLDEKVQKAIRRYVELRMDMQDCLEIKFYLRGHSDCIRYLLQCGLIE